MVEKKIQIALEEGFDEYNKYLKNNQFLFVYKNQLRSYKYFILKFERNNFLHLTGLKYKGKPNKFYSELENQKLSYKLVSIRKDGTTRLKLDVLKQLRQITITPTQVGNFSADGVRLSLDKVVGKTSGLLTLGLKQDGKHFIPNSLLKIDAKKLSNKLYPIALVMKAPYNCNKFSEITYQSKNPKIYDKDLICKVINDIIK